jgi:hypothetical protein
MSLSHTGIFPRLARPEICLRPLPSLTHLAVVVWAPPLDDDAPLPLLRPYSTRPGGWLAFALTAVPPSAPVPAHVSRE